MTPAQVRRKALTIKKHIDKWNTAYKELQTICLHTDHYQKKNGSTGNWDRGDDAYWIEHYCADCDKRWVTDQ